MKYFGTDGIRLYDFEKLEKIAIKYAFALHKVRAKTIILGRDSRPNGKLLFKKIAKAFNLLGIKVLNLGIVPSSAVSFYTNHLGADFGLMLTASHNPVYVNGIKTFKSNGEKLTIKEEKHFENLIDSFKDNCPIEKIELYVKENKIKKSNTKKQDIKEYLALLELHTPLLQEKIIVLDCANGAAKKIASKVFEKSKAKVYTINTGSGKKINDDCGAVYPQSLQKEVLKRKADIGFALDGDADRCVVVTKSGQVASGDNILFGVATFYNFAKVVGTIYSNGGLDEALAKKGITLYRSSVGDQAVKNLMNKTHCTFGGERSGHFIFNDVLATGDGLLTALKVSAVKNFEKKINFKKARSKTLNLETANKQALLRKINKQKEKWALLMDNKGRVLVRASGTENVVRVLIEHPQAKIITKIENLLTNLE